MTEDKDFGQLVFAHGEKSLGVLFLRFPFPARAQIARDVSDLIMQQGEKLIGCFVTIQPGRIRISHIPEGWIAGGTCHPILPPAGIGAVHLVPMPRWYVEKVRNIMTFLQEMEDVQELRDVPSWGFEGHNTFFQTSAKYAPRINEWLRLKENGCDLSKLEI